MDTTVSPPQIPLMKTTFFHEKTTKEQLCDFLLGAEKLSFGEQCLQFEQEFAARQKTSYATFVSSGSAANLVLLQAIQNLGLLRREDRVGFSALTWPTNIMPILQLGMTPVPLDCELHSLNVSSHEIEKHIDQVQAIFLTNVLGFCDDLDRIRDICQEKNILLIEDNCESLGSQYAQTLLGNFGLASTHSFFVGHHLSTIEGGMICTNNEELHDMLKITRAHGWDRHLSEDAQQRIRQKHNVDAFHARYTFYDLAYNARPTEINAFLGRIQLPYLDEIVSKREKNFHRFREVVSRYQEYYSSPDAQHMDRVSNFAMPILCRTEQHKQVCVQKFTNTGIEVRPIIAGDMTQQPFYKKYAPPSYCPNAAQIHQRGFYFPNRPDLTEEEIHILCSTLSSATQELS